MSKMRYLVLLVAAAAIVVSGCSSTPKVEADQARINIVASSTDVLAGDSVSLKALVYDEEGKLVTASPKWRIVNDDRTGTLSRTTGDTVNFRALKAGRAVVESEYNNMKSTVEITVRARPTVQTQKPPK